jgi:hypothetical protein
MPYVHLANGDVQHLNAAEYAKVFGNETPKAFRDNGTEHVVIGVYPDEVEYDTSVDEATQKAADDHAEFDAWKAERDRNAEKGSDTE